VLLGGVEIAIIRGDGDAIQRYVLNKRHVHGVQSRTRFTRQPVSLPSPPAVRRHPLARCRIECLIQLTRVIPLIAFASHAAPRAEARMRAPFAT
jgi:hypothetical protein